MADVTAALQEVTGEVDAAEAKRLRKAAKRAAADVAAIEEDTPAEMPNRVDKKKVRTVEEIRLAAKRDFAEARKAEGQRKAVKWTATKAAGPVAVAGALPAATE